MTCRDHTASVLAFSNNKKKCLFLLEPNPVVDMTPQKGSRRRPQSLHSSSDPRPAAGLSPSRRGGSFSGEGLTWDIWESLCLPDHYTQTLSDNYTSETQEV